MVDADYYIIECQLATKRSRPAWENALDSHSTV
jgi:hypothetical protein